MIVRELKLMNEWKQDTSSRYDARFSFPIQFTLLNLLKVEYFCFSVDLEKSAKAIEVNAEMKGAMYFTYRSTKNMPWIGTV